MYAVYICYGMTLGESAYFYVIKGRLKNYLDITFRLFYFYDFRNVYDYIFELYFEHRDANLEGSSQRFLHMN